MHRFVQLLLRVLPPVGILLASGYAYSVLSVKPEESKRGKAAARKIRTRVAELEVGSYRVRVKTNGTVLPHNHVTLSADVAGNVVSVKAAMEVGSYFSEGDVLVEIDDRDYRAALATARAQQKVALATQRQATSAMSRLERLRTRSAVSEVDVEDAQAVLTRAEGELERIATQIEQAERDLERTKVIAPFDGRVEIKLVGIGQRVATGTPLASVFAVDFAEVRLPLARRDLRFLSLPEKSSDLPVAVELRDAIDESSDTTWAAKIVRTEGTLDADSLELFAIARIDDPFGLKSGKSPLRVGQPVVASIEGEVLQGVVLIPRGAVRQLDQVHLVSDELTLNSMTIEPVWSDDEHIVIRDPSIATGDLLATTRLVYAPEGSEVEIIPDVVAEEDSADALFSVKADKQ